MRHTGGCGIGLTPLHLGRAKLGTAFYLFHSGAVSECGVVEAVCVVVCKYAGCDAGYVVHAVHAIPQRAHAVHAIPQRVRAR